jgi:hypothetical protein
MRYLLLILFRSVIETEPNFEVVEGLTWSYDLESVATGRVTHAGQVKGDDPDKQGYPGPPVWGLGVGLTTSPRKKTLTVENLLMIAAGRKHQMVMKVTRSRPMVSMNKTDQGSSWPAEPAEE